MKLPKYLKRYFWNVRFDALDPDKDNRTVITRLLEHGDGRAVRWLFRHYPREQIETTLKQSRDFSLRSCNFWAVVLNLKREELICFQEPYLTIRKELWPY